MDVFFSYRDFFVLVFLVLFFFAAGVQFARFFMCLPIQKKLQSELASKVREAEQAKKETEQIKKKAEQAKKETEQAKKETEQAKKETEQAKKETEQAKRDFFGLSCEIREERKQLTIEKKKAINQQKRYERQQGNLSQIIEKGIQKGIQQAEWEQAERNAYLPYEDRS
jgi:septal ring factor EnvC (AmiA/AmiB activator)